MLEPSAFAPATAKPRFARAVGIVLVALAVLVALLGGAPAWADEILTYGNGILHRTSLPAGPSTGSVAVDGTIRNLYVLPSGMVLVTSFVPGPPRTMLSELRPDGSLRQIGALPPDPEYPQENVNDMAVDHRGRLYLLVRYENHGVHFPVHRLLEVDPLTGAVLASRQNIIARGLATAPDGLWALVDNEIRKLDPETLVLGPPVADLESFGYAYDLDSDSEGRLYFRYESSCGPPPCPTLGRFDPADGVAEPAPPALYEETPQMTLFAIERRCSDSATSRCLQGGRFRAQVDFAAYDGVAGPAQAAPARSADTAIFSFFDPDNWELMVKVLDGCAINSHFWVYSSASTDVQYTMTITDTQTGAVKVYQNPLGQIARTVTDNLAFPCGN